DGAFPPTEAEVLATAIASEVEAELRAQVARVRASGVTPTHLDSHMGVLYERADLFAILRQIALDEKLPVRLARHWWHTQPFLDDPDLTEGLIGIDELVSPSEDVAPEEWTAYYRRALH